MNSCSKSSEGWMSSKAFKMPSLQMNVKSHSNETTWRIQFIVMPKWLFDIQSYTAKSSSYRGACLTAGTGLAASHNSRHKLPAINIKWSLKNFSDMIQKEHKAYIYLIVLLYPTAYTCHNELWQQSEFITGWVLLDI